MKLKYLWINQKAPLRHKIFALIDYPFLRIRIWWKFHKELIELLKIMLCDC